MYKDITLWARSGSAQIHVALRLGDRFDMPTFLAAYAEHPMRVHGEPRQPQGRTVFVARAQQVVARPEPSLMSALW